MQLDFRCSAPELHALAAGALLSSGPAAGFRIEGPGALECLQGLLTCDVVGPGDGSLVYGALLTSKGMIVVDPWVMREAGGRFTLLLPEHAREPALALLRRALPPRLARVSELPEEWSASWLLGPAGLERFTRAAGVAPPPRGRVGPALRDGSGLLAAGPPTAPFSGLVLAPRSGLAPALERFTQAGGLCAGPEAVAAAYILAGWPSLGREIDERTLPQEVRYDELGAVSYAKGCYTGQETVARVHFRGHVNRSLRGISVAGAEPPEDRALLWEGKPVGELRSALLLPDRLIGLARVRREAEPAALLQLGARPAQQVALPFPGGLTA